MTGGGVRDMWKEYSSGYLKNNRAAGASIATVVFVCAVLLSLLCGFLFNLWRYEVERVKLEEGNWQSRLTGVLSDEDLALLENYPGVEQVAIDEELSGNGIIAADIIFSDRTTVFAETPRLAALVALPEDAVSYHYDLLSLYLVRSPDDPALHWVFPFYLLVTAAACLSLVLIIHNAFAVAMDGRVRQLGILSSIGATPRQLRGCLLREALSLSALPAVMGNLLGILACAGVMRLIDLLAADIAGRMRLPFQYHPLIFVLSLLATFLTVWCSAWLPARKLARLSPMEAIKNPGEYQPRKKSRSPILSRLFGPEGELAGNALRANRKSMRTANRSLTLSFLAFSFMLCFFTLLRVNQNETYFERYQNAWDVMVTVKNAALEDFSELDELRKLPGVESGTAYQQSAAKRLVTWEEFSDQLRELGGLEAASSDEAAPLDGGWLVNAPLVILDDDSFLEYCRKIGAEPTLSGAVILNQIRDASDPNFRQRRTLPYLAGDSETTALRQTAEDAPLEFTVLAYTQEVPLLRKEYGTLDSSELTHFLPLSLWKEIKGRLDGAEDDITVRILARDGATLSELDGLSEAVTGLLGERYELEVENRLREKLDNDRMFRGMMAVVGLFCGLLAVIGIGSVFANTFGFARQRRREFARYLSIGMTPGGMKKLFCVEALVIAGKPVLLAAPITAAATAFFLGMAYLDPAVFLRQLPWTPMLLFVLAVFGFVALAYSIGGKRVMEGGLVDALRDDTLI